MKRRGFFARPGVLGLVLAVGAGGLGVLFLADPKVSHARWLRLRDRSAARLRQGRRRLKRLSHHLGSDALGLSRRLAHPRPAQPEDERTLRDRVESELFGESRIPKGRIILGVEGTTVVLRGQLESAEDIQLVEAATRRIPGVGGLESYLHLPNTPAPNKADALRASAKAAAEQQRRTGP